MNVRRYVLAVSGAALLSVPGLAAAQRAEPLFRGRTGDERIVPDNPPSDQELAARVTQALESDPYVGDQHIRVEAVNGVVVVSSTVDTPFQRAHAERVAARVRDVEAVVSDLDVASSMNGEHQSDAELLADVRNEIYWNPQLDLDDVQVGVENGTVRLTGTVESYKARGAMIDEARQAGATRIEHDIVVRSDGAPTGAASQGQ